MGYHRKKDGNRQILSERSNTLGPVEYHLVTCVDTCCDLPLEANTPLIFQRLQGTLPGQGQSFPELLRQIEAPASQCAEHTMWIPCLYDVHMLSIVLHCDLHSSMHKHTVEIQGRPCTAEGTRRCVEKASKSSRSRMIKANEILPAQSMLNSGSISKWSSNFKQYKVTQLQASSSPNVPHITCRYLSVDRLSDELWRSLEIFGCASAAKERETGRDSPCELRGFSDSS